MTKHVLQKVSENVTGKLVFKKNKVPIVLTSQKMMDNSLKLIDFCVTVIQGKCIVKTLCQNDKFRNVALFRILFYYVEHNH